MHRGGLNYHAKSMNKVEIKERGPMGEKNVVNGEESREEGGK
jgi:hypothetical protein